MTYRVVSSVQFPEYHGDLLVNMMPIVFGDRNTIPEDLHGYLPIIEKCQLTPGKLAYLTIHESVVKAGISQRRPGVHTEGTRAGGWGGGGWGKKGVFMASSDGSCRIWNSSVPGEDVNEHGTLLIAPPGPSEKMEASVLYWLTDRTPHEALTVEEDTKRQFFRLVSDEVDFWWKQHSTPNPLGIQPGCKILTHSKF